jgi:hypothetical protein
MQAGSMRRPARVSWTTTEPITASRSVARAYGTCETPEFQRQNREFAAAVEASGKVVELLVGEHYKHFDLHETLGNPYGLLGRAALDLMGLASVSP